MDTATSARPTCGTLYRLFEEQCPTLAFLQPAAIPHGDVRLADRALGHMRGQAEKVYLGACQAFMIRPAADWLGWAMDAMVFTCHHYHLRAKVCLGWKEIWGYTENSLVQLMMDTMASEPENSPVWHELRGALCGIPHQCIDTRYHERAGFGMRCEPDAEQESEATHCPNGTPHLPTRKRGAANAFCTLCGYSPL